MAAQIDKEDNTDPLLAACSQGDFVHVKYLIRVGADVNGMCNGMTPLMEASSRGHHNIVGYLLRCGANVNQQNMNGNNAVHQCVNYDRLKCLKILVRNGAQLDMKYKGMTPLQMACSIEGAAEIVEYLISLPWCSRARKIEALELLGAAYIDIKADRENAHYYWFRSLEEREGAEPGDNVPPKREGHHPAFDAIEFQTDEEVTNMQSDGMSMQSLLIRERIFGPQHSHIVTSVVHHATLYADEGEFDRSIALLAYILDIQRKTDGVGDWTWQDLCSLTYMFSRLLFEGSPVKYKDVVAAFMKAVDVLEHEMKHGMWNCSAHFFDLEDVLLSVTNLAELQPSVSEDERLEFHRIMSRLVYLDVRDDDGQTLLHWACLFEAVPLDVVQLLLDAGADPEAVSLSGDTTLHCVAYNEHPTQHQIIKLLLSSGAHYDACNAEGKHFTELMGSENKFMPENPMDYCSLQCLSAKAVKRYGVPYQSKVPINVAKFIKLH